jgi:predicted PurR-regulated permease PerM
VSLDKDIPHIPDILENAVNAEAGTSRQPRPASCDRDSSSDSAPHPSLKRRLARWFLVGLVVCGIFWLFWSARSALLPFEIGLILAYLLIPLVNSLNTRMPRLVAIIFVYLGSLLLLIGFFAYIVPLLWYQAGQLIESIPDFDIQDIRVQINEFLGEYKRLVPPEVQDAVQASLNTTYETFKANLVSYAKGVGTFLLDNTLRVINTVIFLFGFIIVPIWMFHIINDYRAGSAAINQMLPNRVRADFWAVVAIVDRVLSSYIRGQLILGIVIGCAAGVGLFSLRLFGLEVQNILFLAVLAGFTELIPYVGPLLGAIPAVVFGFFDSPTTGIAVAALYFLIQILENNFLVPRIIGDSLDIHPAVLIVLMIVCGQVFGLVGIILVAPISAMVRDVFLYTYGRLRDDPIPAGHIPSPKRATDSSAE